MEENTPNDEVEDLEVEADDIAGGMLSVYSNTVQGSLPAVQSGLPAVQGIASNTNIKL